MSTAVKLLAFFYQVLDHPFPSELLRIRPGAAAALGRRGAPGRHQGVRRPAASRTRRLHQGARQGKIHEGQEGFLLL